MRSAGGTAQREEPKDDGGRLRVLWRAMVERFRSSFFGIPFLWLGGSIALWLAAGQVDRTLSDDRLPFVLDTTVRSARALLGAIASGTIAAASVVFSLTLVAIQLSSSVYSSRVLRTFLRDRFQQHMMGIVLATFFFSLLVLREVRGPLEEGGSAYIPRVSATLATWMALAAVLALLASISHTAQSIRVSRVSAELVDEMRAVIIDRFDDDDGGAAPLSVQAPGLAPSPLGVATPGGHGAPPSGVTGVPAVVTALAGGWVQQVSVQAVARAVSPGTTVRLEVVVGTYVFCGSPLATVWPAPAPEEVDDWAEGLRAAVRVGGERTTQQDIGFGLIMLEDIVLRALSPGINDPNTAQAVIPQIGELLLEILSRELPATRVVVGEVHILRDAAPGYQDYVEAAVGQIRRFAVEQPAVILTLGRTLVTVGHELGRRGCDSPEAMAALQQGLARLDPGVGSTDPAVVELHRLLAATDWC